MKPIHKILLGILAVVAVGFIVAYLYPSTPSHSGKLTKRETNVVQAKIDKEHQRAKADTLASAALTGQAKQAVAAAQGTRKQALEFHKRSKSHASPVPTTAAGIDSLQSFFSTYGDRPADER